MLSSRVFFFFSSRRRHTRSLCDWSSDVCSSDLVEPVNLVAEENRAAAFVLEPLLRLLDDLPHPRHTLGHGRKRLELPGGVVGDETGERGLPRAGGPPEDARPHVAAADQLPQGFAGPEQVLLAEKVLKRCGAHAGGEGLATPPLTAPLEERGFRHGMRDAGWAPRDAGCGMRAGGMRDAGCGMRANRTRVQECGGVASAGPSYVRRREQ